MYQPVVVNARQWLRFIVAGTFNTALSYGCYLFLASYITYQLAYLCAYALGVVAAYGLNAKYVFRLSCSWRGLFSYPIVYVVQYGLGALLLWIMVQWVGLSQTLAPLPVMVCLVPLSYLINKAMLALLHKRQQL